MVRGHLFYRRAASVPPTDYRLETPVSSKAYLISSHAVQDADAMRAKSRRNDANFLHDVSNKLASGTAHLGSPYSSYVGSHYPTTNLYPATASYPYYSYSAYPYTTYPNHYYPTDYRHRTWYAPPVSDYEVTSYLTGGPRPYYGRYSRAGSVPPSSSVPRWNSSYARAPSVGRYPRSSVGPYDDVVVGVAHTAQYGDIVIGMPSNKKHMFQNNNHYKGGNNYRSYYYPSFANRHSIAPTNHYPTIGAVSVKPSYRRASIAVPYRNAYDSDLDVVSTPRYYSGYGSERSRDSVAALRSTAQSVQQQLAGIPQFQFFDTEAPAGVTVSRPRAASSVPTFRAAGASLASSPSVSAPSKGYSSGYTGGSTSTGGGYTRAGSVPVGFTPGPPKYTKPPVSETRRKVRDLLCKSKKDPHYFD